MLRKSLAFKFKAMVMSFACLIFVSAGIPFDEAVAASSAQKSSQSTSKKSAAKNTSANKSAASKSAAKKSSSKNTAAKKSSANKSAASKSAAKKTAAQKAPAKKTAAKSAAPKNTASTAPASSAAKAAAKTAAAAAAGAAASTAIASTVDPSMIEKLRASMGDGAKEMSMDFFESVPKSRISKMRDAYIQAENAFKRGDEALGFEIQREQLKGYPLNIWLNYYYLAYNIRDEKFEAAMQFIERNEQAELSEMLKDRYARYLSENKDYQRLSRLVGDKPFDETALTTLSHNQKSQICRYYEANWPLNRVTGDAVHFATRMYLELGNRPAACNALIVQMDARGYLTDALRLKRYESAYVQRYYQETTESLARVLNTTSFGKRVEAQMALYSNPSELFSKVEGNSEQEHRTAVLAFKRYANLWPEQARSDFDRFIKKYKPSNAELVDIYQIFASSFLGRAFELSDVEWVDRNLPAVAWNTRLKEQRLRRAIYFAQWQNVYVLIDHLPEDLRNAVNWRYWKGRAAHELGKSAEADTILSEVARDRSFFGFYAAQTLKKDYAFNYARISPDYSYPMDIASNKAAIRFMELHALDDDNAIYEWREIARRSPEHEAMVMAQWALNSGNFRYAIDYVISSENWNALDYRFPLAFRGIFEQYAKQSNVPLSFLYGISRQESMLNHSIKSWAGAVGLMQVMPGTAKDIARRENWKFSGASDLLDPETNVRFGSTYARWMLDRFDNNRILAAAAYNAGPGRIPQWKSTDGIFRDTAMYVETIPFEETRKYVQNVILYDAIYNYLLTGDKGSLIRPNEMSYVY